jgi:hypothetical protein
LGWLFSDNTAITTLLVDGLNMVLSIVFSLAQGSTRFSGFLVQAVTLENFLT